MGSELHCQVCGGGDSPGNSPALCLDFAGPAMPVAMRCILDLGRLHLMRTQGFRA